tara:strand:- start:1076 stop:1795 length:720 start_codon:yes stop_codon:yes gene_type:complete
MGAKQGASKGGMSNKTAESSAVVQAKRAEEYAKKKLGITETVAGPIKGANTSVTGIYSTAVPNQMYGDKFREAQGEYLASQGLATAREITDATGKKFTVYDKSKELMDAVNRTRIPLSKQMYQSQQNFKLGIAAVSAAAGIPLMPGILFHQSQVPYQNYINKNKQMFSYQNIDSGSNQTSNQTSDQTTQMGNEDPNTFRADKTDTRKKYLASLKDGDTSKGDRKFITGSRQGFGGEYTV